MTQEPPTQIDYTEMVKNSAIELAGILLRRGYEGRKTELVDCVCLREDFVPKAGKIRLEITPSTDTHIGAHLDADVFLDEYSPTHRIAHATIFSDITKNFQRERAGYVLTLINAGGQINFSSEGYNYRIILKKKITVSDSVALEAFLSKHT